jgi:hypothetical protein
VALHQREVRPSRFVTGSMLPPSGLILEGHRQDGGRFSGIDLGQFPVGNLVPVTIDNIIGRSILVAAVY